MTATTRVDVPRPWDARATAVPAYNLKCLENRWVKHWRLGRAGLSFEAAVPCATRHRAPARRALHTTDDATDPPELSTYSRLVGASRHRAMAGPGSRSLSTGDGPRDVSFGFLSGPGERVPSDRVALSGDESRVSSGTANGEPERWNQERRALSLRGRVSLRSTHKRGHRTTQVNHTQTRKT